MAFFDKVGEALTNVGKGASQKARDLTDLAKLNMELKSKQDFIERQYTEIGKKVYETQKNDESSPFEQVFAIKQTEEEIDTLRHEIAQAKGCSVCPHCGADVEKDVVYCPKCGKKIAKEA